MRIGLITNLMDGHGAGIGRYTENLVKNLLFIDKKNEYYLIHSNKKSYEFKGNYQEIKLPFFDSIPKKLITGAFVIEKICRDNRLDILHDVGQISPYFFPSRTKRILTIFDLSPILYPQFFTLLTRSYMKLLPQIVRNTDSIITISENSKKDIMRLLGVSKEKITVTHLGIERKFKPLKDKRHLNEIRNKYRLPRKFILFVGTIEPRKNLPALIEAYHAVAQKIDISLVIAGQIGWKYADVFEAIRKYSLQKQVIFTGYVDDNDLPALYNLAEVFVYPSLYEGFGFPVLEAMASGCPVITSSTSSLPEITGNAAILIDPMDIMSITKAILKTVLNKKMRLDMVERGLGQAKKFSWKNCVFNTLNNYEKIYESL